MTRPIIVASHRRSGTHLTLDLLRANIRELAAERSRPIVTLESLVDRGVVDSEGQSHPLLKTHSHGDVASFFRSAPSARSILRDSVVVYVARDGRDVLLSQYHYQKGFDESLRDVDLHAYLTQANEFDANTYSGSKNRPQYWSYHLTTWSDAATEVFLRYEDILQDPNRAIRRVADAAGLTAQPSLRDMRLSGLPPWRVRLRKAQSRLMGRRDTTAVAFRSGKAGEWKATFTDADQKFFDSAAREGLDVLARHQ